MAADRKSTRAKKGNKMRALLAYGDELPDDDIFWSKGGEGANVWEIVDKVQIEDEDFGGADSQGEDSVDTDFDEPEEPVLENEVGEEPEEVKKKKKNVYVDPKRKKGKASKKRKKRIGGGYGRRGTTQ